MKLNEVLKFYGGKKKHAPTVAIKLGFTSACVYGWVEKTYIPYHSQIIIELHSAGKFKADKAHGKRDKAARK